MKPSRKSAGISVLLSFAALIQSCGEPKTPSRDHIPLIKERISRLQQAIRDRNPSSIDSLMSVEILKYDLGSDSLLKFVYGPDGAFAFQSFGQPDIIYTDDIALVKGFVMDSSGRKDLPVVLTLRFDSDQWLLSRFEIDTAGRDSL